MSVDPHYQAILDRINALPPLDLTRPAVALAQEMRAAPVLIPPIPHPVAVEVRKIPAAEGHLIPVRIYRPLSPGPHGVLLSMHGGGWVRGSLDGDEYRSHLIAHESGCVVVSIDYRMAPEHPFPAPLEDCYAVLTWVAEQSSAAGFRAGKIGVFGDSAGGNLAAALAIMTRDRAGPKIACLILLHPVCDHDFDTPSYHENGEGKLLTRTMMMWFWDQYAGQADRTNPYVSPLRCTDLTGLPAALVLTAEFDPLRDEGESFAKSLSAAGCAVTQERLGGVIHAFQSVAVEHPLSLASLKTIASFARRHLSD
ncbi:alpha/beta hydrolase [Novosphingobium cyanobacteriorum]|uniref:Alpha/beta hydrolase n=1 Tax=Novosphingobium cyanobacteriorum TaxID=3024215 RepID=A0ABT6CN67_9SPHN|nr:alpha/beta hydrolase [Novosphingobium cyanobacteriorum]MDF8335365.1 alpha/beta hydrolase [Novosphingobium cyanobacteriorum]